MSVQACRSVGWLARRSCGAVICLLCAGMAEPTFCAALCCKEIQRCCTSRLARWGSCVEAAVCGSRPADEEVGAKRVAGSTAASVELLCVCTDRFRGQSLRREGYLFRAESSQKLSSSAKKRQSKLITASHCKSRVTLLLVSAAMKPLTQLHRRGHSHGEAAFTSQVSWV